MAYRDRELMKVYVVEECEKWEGGTTEAVCYSESVAIEIAKKGIRRHDTEPRVTIYEKGLNDDDRRIVYIEPRDKDSHHFWTVEEFDVTRDEEYIGE